MNKTEAIKAFWSSFGLKAYNEQSVPQGDRAPDFPYITYQANTAGMMGSVALTGSVWYRSTSPAGVDIKTEEMAKYIGSHKVLKCDEGYIIIRQGSPFSLMSSDPSDDMIKRRIINITAEFDTVY